LSNRLQRRVCSLALVVLCALGAGVVGLEGFVHGQDLAWTAQLGGVDASGSKRIPTAQVVAMAGLRIGSVIGPRDIEAAQQRLVASGYFRTVGSRFRNAGYSVIVTFTLEDVAWKTPVVFDNFVDQTDAQLITAIARDVPSFDGVAPDRDVVLKRIATSLEGVARAAKDPGVVNFAMVTAAGGGAADRWRFHLDRASGPLPVCAIVLSGVTEPTSGPVNDRKAGLIGADYSRDRILQFARETFVPLLQPPVTVKRVDAARAPVSDSCARGVVVTVTMGTGLFSTDFGT
jgi:hypothetical protein